MARLARMPELLGTRRGTISREEAADRVSAYVYGNIIVLAALAGIHPPDAQHWSSVWSLFGVGLATLVAHVFSDLSGHRVRHDEHPGLHDVLHELAVARPIATSTLAPAVPLATGCLGWIGGRTAMTVAFAVIALRLAWIGNLMARQSGRRSSARVVLSGLGFAVLAVAIAAVKVRLSH